MLLLLSVITYLDRVCISVALPAMSQDLGFTPSQRGWILGVFTLAYGVFEIPGGWMGDKFGPRKILTRIVVWWSAFTALTGMVTGYMQLLVVRFLFGAGEAGAYPNSSAAISRWFPVYERAGAHGWVWMASRLGGALAPVLVVPIQQGFGWRTSFFVFSLLGVVWAVFWWGWFRDNPSDQPEMSQEELELIGPPPRRGHGELTFGQALRSKNLWIVMAMYHAFCYGSYWYIAWTPSYLEAAKGMSAGVLAAGSALPFVLGAIANAVGGVVSDRAVRKLGLKWGRRLVGAGGVGLAGVFMLVSLAIENPYVATVVLALGFAASDFMLPTCWAVCLDIGRDNAGAVTGAMNTAGQIGATIMAVAYGGFVEQYGWNLPLTAIAAMSILSAGLWMAIDPTQPLKKEAREAVAA